MKKKAVIFGISGQDGAYLANFLVGKNYKIIGITRNLSKKNLFRLKKLNILRKIKLLKGTAVNTFMILITYLVLCIGFMQYFKNSKQW